MDSPPTTAKLVPLSGLIPLGLAVIAAFIGRAPVPVRAHARIGAGARP